jgi:tetratricopeptide (TPR) repeat protein
MDEETRNLLEESFGTEHPQTLRLLASLALDHGLNSDFIHAKELYQYVFPRMNQPGQATPAVDLMSVWNGLAWALRSLGEYRDALDVVQEALDYGQENLGAEHLATLRSINAFAIVCRRFPNRHEEAMETSRSCFELSRRLFGENHPDTLATAVSLSNLLRAINEDYHAEALAIAEDAARRFPDAYGPQHPYNYVSIGNLALLRRVTGDATVARALNTEALSGLKQGLGPDHYYTLTVATNLASDLTMLGLPEEARILGEDTLGRMKWVRGPDHPVTLGCATNLALDMMASGNAAGGRKLQEETLARFRRVLGDQHPDTLVAEGGGRLDPDFDPPPI